MKPLLGDVTAVLMAKRPEPGRTKTRLVSAGLDERQAARVAWVMLRCTAQRLAAAGRLVLAVSPDGCGQEMAAELELGGGPQLDQGPGSLGDRLRRVWGRLNPERPVAFFGYDSPDVPDRLLEAIPVALGTAEAAAGPTGDGGYWTLAARRHLPALVARIDWGSRSVYDQTCERAAEAGVSLTALPPWPDVDRPDDLAALSRRLRDLASPPNEATPSEAPLHRLAEQLERLTTAAPQASGGEAGGAE